MMVTDIASDGSDGALRSAHAASFLTTLLGAFGDGWRAAAALPLLALAMVAIELAQHLVEVRLGFFSRDPAVRAAASMDSLRLAFGWLKMLVVWGLGFVAIRHLLLSDARAAMRPDRLAVRRYAWVVLFQFVPFVAILYAAGITYAAGLGPDAVTPFRAVFGILQQLLEPALCLWFVCAALGSEAFGPIGSAKATRWLYFWALALIFLARTPVNAAHQLLNRYAAGHPPAVMWAMLVIDALGVVGVATVTAAAQVGVARYVAARRFLEMPVTDRREREHVR